MQFLVDLHPRSLLMLALAGFAACIGAWSLIAVPSVSMLGLALGVSLLMAAALLFAGLLVLNALHRNEHKAIRTLLDNSETPCLLVSGRDQALLWQNRAVVATFGAVPDIRTLLDDYCASPMSVIAQAHEQATAQGNAIRTLQIGANACRVEIVLTKGGDYLWRIPANPSAPDSPDLPLEWVLCDLSGRVQYISPLLATHFETAPAHLQDILGPDCPEPGQITQVRLTQTSQTRLALTLPQGTDSRGVLFLPADLDRPTPDDGDAALNLLPVAITHIAPDGRIAFANREARRLLHLNKHDDALFSDRLEGLGRPIHEWMEDVRSGRLKRSTEVMRLVRHGEETYIQVSLRALTTGPDGYTLAVMNDATELKSLEAKFTQSQKMQAIGLLAGGVAHDFNNLLTAISGHCDLILLHHDRSDLDYPDLMQIQQNTNRAAALVRQLLALSRQQALKFVTLDLEETMSDLIHLLNRLVGEKVTLTLQHGEKVAPIRSDRRQFEQVLMNLVVNARDAMPMGGEIRIVTETCALPDGLVRAEVHMPAGTYTRISVQDDGIGMPPCVLAKVFDPFFTTKRLGEGTGLGLSTVYGIVKQSGGYIFADSAEGVGTTFSLYFAAQKQVVAEKPLSKPNLQTTALDERRALVLLVEDEAPVRSFAARALELQGHRVIEAESGEAALEILEDPNIRPDFFVTDVIMPGIDGPGWIAKIRDRFPDTPVLFVSGYAEDGRVAAQSRISNASFLGKPFSLAEFTTTVNDQLRGRTKAA